MSNSVLVEESEGILIEVEDNATVIETLPDASVQVEDGAFSVVADQPDITELTVNETTATVIETLYVLPTETVSEEEQVYAKRVDFVDETTIYRGEAAVGTLESQSGWRIRRFTLASDDDVTEEWANGNANFVNIWDNRASYPYS